MEAQIEELLSNELAANGDKLAELRRLGARLVLLRAVEDEVTFLGRARYARTPEAAGSHNGTRQLPCSARLAPSASRAWAARHAPGYRAVAPGQLVGQLANNGWIRAFHSSDATTDAVGRRPGRPRQLSLVEVTPTGRREAAQRLLLPATVAARHHGLLGKDASTRRFSRHLAHTLSANEVFVAFVLAARRMTTSGGDEALEEWRSAAACARGRFRPDGYGCYRRGTSRFGVFLEFDPGTVKPREYAAKLATYKRYRDAGTANRDYTGFPTLLVVTTGAGAETRFAHQVHLAQQRHAAAPLVIFLTITSHIDGCADGVLGPIWRSPSKPWAAEPARIWWLPSPGRFALIRAEGGLQIPAEAGQPLLRGSQASSDSAVELVHSVGADESVFRPDVANEVAHRLYQLVAPRRSPTSPLWRLALGRIRLCRARVGEPGQAGLCFR